MEKHSLSAVKILTITALMLGAFSVSVLADWTAAKHAPPSCPTGEDGCDAPLNVGPNGQGKAGGVAIGKDQSAPETGLKLEVFGLARFREDLGVAGTVRTVSLEVGDVDETVTSNPRQVLTNTGDGKAKWAAPFVPQTQSVSCTESANTSYISLNGNNSGNNGTLIVNVGTLSPGQYKISGSGIQTYNVGGAGYAGVILSDSPNLTQSEVVSFINGNMTQNKLYFQSDNSDTVFVLKRSGSNDQILNVSTETFNLTNTRYMYVILAQAAISGSLTVDSPKSICSGGTATTGGGYHYFTPIKSVITEGETNTPGIVADGNMGFSNNGIASWKTINFPSTSVVPTTAKSLILRAYVSGENCNVQMYVTSSNFTAQTVANSNNAGGGGSDSAIFNLPNNPERRFQATSAVSGPNACSNIIRNVYIIGYTD